MKSNDIKMNIDPQLTDDKELNIEGVKINYGDLKNMFPINRTSSINCLIYWDDVCQYTSIALIELINSLYKTNAKPDIEHFFTRPNEYSNGMEYVYKVFEKVLKKEEIDEIKHKFYWKILTFSAKSTVYMSIINTNSFYGSLGFYFPCRFENDEKLRVDFKNVFFPNSIMENIKFIYATDEPDFDSLLSKYGYNSVITPNMRKTFEYILTNDIKRITILGPEDHNGFEDEHYKLFEKYKGIPMPNYCDIRTYKEMIVR